MDIENLKRFIKNTVKHEVAEQLKIQSKPITIPEKLLNKTELAKELNVSRQTIANWLKNEKTAGVIKEASYLKGGRTLYNYYSIIKSYQEGKLRLKDSVLIAEEAHEKRMRETKYQELIEKAKFGKCLSDEEEDFLFWVRESRQEENMA